jgi:hypothetical protein
MIRYFKADNTFVFQCDNATEEMELSNMLESLKQQYHLEETQWMELDFFEGAEIYHDSFE